MFKSNIDFTLKLMVAEPSNTEQGHTHKEDRGTIEHTTRHLKTDGTHLNLCLL